jgi:hypothetical protein
MVSGMSPTDTADAERAGFGARLEEEQAAFVARLRAEFDVRSPARIQQDVDRLKAALGRLGFDVRWRGLRLALRKAGYSVRESASLSLGIVVKTLEARVEAQDRIKDQAMQKAPSALRKAKRAPGDRRRSRRAGARAVTERASKR